MVTKVKKMAAVAEVAAEVEAIEEDVVEEGAEAIVAVDSKTNS